MVVEKYWAFCFFQHCNREGAYPLETMDGQPLASVEGHGIKVDVEDKTMVFQACPQDTFQSSSLAAQVCTVVRLAYKPCYQLLTLNKHMLHTQLACYCLFVPLTLHNLGFGGVVKCNHGPNVLQVSKWGDQPNGVYLTPDVPNFPGVDSVRLPNFLFQASWAHATSYLIPES